MAKWAGRSLTPAALAAIVLPPQSMAAKATNPPAASIPSREEFLGHRMGALSAVA